jgi:hypothetical protein
MSSTYRRLSLALFILAGSSVLAQTTVAIGGSAGVNLSKFRRARQVDAEESRMVGLHFAVPLELRFNKVVALQLEPGFIQKGSKLTSFDQFAQSRISINYLELPVMLKLILEPKLQFHIVAGGTAAVGVSGKAVYKNRNGQRKEDDLDFFRDAVNRFDMGVIAGFGVKIPVKKIFLTLDGRYAYGLSDLLKKYSGGDKITNTGIHFSAGLLFPLGKKPAETKNKISK